MFEMPKEKRVLSKKTYVFLASVFIPLFIFFSFGFFHISKFETTDAHFWIKADGTGRIQKYWNSIRKENWSKTKINDKPGVSLAIVSGWPLIFKKHLEEGPEYSIMTPFRISLIAFIGLFSLYFYWAIKRLVNRRAAFFWICLTYLSPVILGISRIINPDSLIWLFSFAAFISWNLFFEKGRKIDLLLGALFLALAILSKYSALMLIPFIFLIALSYHIKGNRIENKNNGKNLRILLGFWIGMAMMAIFFSLAMPSVFVRPGHFYKNLVYFNEMLYIYGTILGVSSLFFIDTVCLKEKLRKFILEIGRKTKEILLGSYLVLFLISGIAVLLNWSAGKNFLNVPDVPFDISQGPKFDALALGEKILLELKPLVFSLTPAALFLFLGSLLYFFIRKKDVHPIAALSILFLGAYYASVLQQGLLVHPRYSMPIYPFLALFTAIGISEFFLEYKLKSKKTFFVLFSLLLLIAQALSLWKIKPFYLAYANDLLPKDEIISNSWGYGGYEAAQYLNSLPDVKNKAVVSDDSVCCRFFIGSCKNSSNIKSSSIKNRKDFDYYVKTRRGTISANTFWRVTLDKKPDLYENLIWSINIDGRDGNYVNIYKNDGN